MKLCKKLTNERQTIGSATAGTNTLRSKRIKTGRIFSTTIIVIENKTSAYTRLRVGIYDTGIFYNYFEEMAPAAGQLYWIEHEMVLAEGQQVQAELQGCTAGDYIEMFIHGRWTFENEKQRSKGKPCRG